MKLKKGWLCLAALLLTVATLILLLGFPAKVSYNGVGAETAFASSTTPVGEISATSTEAEEEKPQALPQVMLDIGWCESRNDQSKTGYNYRHREITLADGSTTTERYLWSRDIGRFQINDYYHTEAARRLGMDIYTEEGNTLYALRLYNTNGTKDWNASKPCWSDIEAWRAREKSYY